MCGRHNGTNFGIRRGECWTDSGTRVEVIMTEWFEDEDFWRVLFPFIFPSEKLESADEEVDSIVALTGFAEGRVLDL
jgi:hypothetical protein